MPSGIRLAPTNRREAWPTRAFLDPQQPPPARHQRLGCVEMPLAHHERREIEDLIVDLELTVQRLQRVAAGLDLVAVELPADDREVDPHLPTTEAQLLDEDAVLLRGVLHVDERAEGGADLGISES